ncbi:MAG TPA: BREX system ATP-binding domain-containing protein, partial [Dehalococcoidia bacterium]|nr:BREX system ATP-binding domain-containing protein [Dehalococcoidia bacterium]
MAHKLQFDSPAFRRFYQWVFSPEADLNPRFPASVLVFQEGKGNRYPEISDRILRFWGGAAVPERDMREWLEELGEESAFKFGKITEKDLVWQRYQFLSQLLVAAGFSGWIILVDEVELIGKYSFGQRARSYAEMARMLGTIDEYRIPG